MIDNKWTLFLDRDGVINRRIVDGYVTKWNEFEFLPGIKVAIKTLSEIFPRIIIVSNQQGIGKGIMSENDLSIIHKKMKEEIEQAGGKVSAIYHCPFLAKDHSILRKPAVGMALKARKDVPGIIFKRSIMAGDSASDMIFGKRLGMKTVFLGDDKFALKKFSRQIDFAYRDLSEFSENLKNNS